MEILITLAGWDRDLDATPLPPADVHVFDEIDTFNMLTVIYADRNIYLLSNLQQ